MGIYAPTIENANLLNFRRSIRPELLANTAGLLEVPVSTVKNTLNEIGNKDINLYGNQSVPSKQMYAEDAQYNTGGIPYGTLTVGGADQALRDLSQYRSPSPEDMLDLTLLGVDAFFPAREGLKLAGKALTSPVAKEMYANAPQVWNRMQQRVTGVNLQPEVFIGENAKTWNKLQAEEFLINEAKGLDPEENWRLTGTFRGVDGLIRQEISDKNAVLNYDKLKVVTGDKKGNQKLVDVYDHPELYKAYPELKDFPISKRRAGDQYAGAVAFGKDGYKELLLNDTYFKNNPKAVNTMPFAMMNSPEATIAHEVQHGIQSIEGMDKGFNLQSARNLNRDLKKQLSKFSDNLEKKNKIVSVLDQVRFNTPMKNYHAKSGEVEARTVQARRELDDQQRRAFYPLFEDSQLKAKSSDPNYRPNVSRYDAFYRKDANPIFGLDYPLDEVYSLKGLGLDGEANAKNLSYIKSTKGKPDQRLGKRFETEDLGGLITPEIVKGKDIEGASLVFKPSDMTSRNQKIISISDELIQPQYRKTTEGGNDFARDAKNIEEDKFYGSTEGKVDNDTFRMIQAYRENIAQGGTGDIGFTPSTMSMYSENFSTMPFENIYPFFVKKGNKAFTDAFDADIRSGKGITGDGFPEFKGVMSPEGYQQAINNPSLRKAIMERIQGNKTIQEELGMNAEDLSNALRSERLRGVPKDHAGDTIVMMDKKLLQKASDMLADANVTHMRRSQLTEKQNKVLDKVLKMFKKPMGKNHRTYNTANTGSSGKVISLDMNAPVMNLYGDDAMDRMLRGQIQYGTDPNKAPKSLLGNKGALDQALFNFYSGHRNTGLFLSPDRVKEIDRMKKSGLFDMKGLL